MATCGGQDSFSEDPALGARSVLFHSGGHHLGAVDPTQSPDDQAAHWLNLIKEMLTCEDDCDDEQMRAVPYHGWFDEVPALREIG
jgi:hypothetical protein